MKLSYNPNYAERAACIVKIYVAEPNETSKLVKEVESRLYPDYRSEGHPMDVVYLDTSAGKNQRIKVSEFNQGYMPPNNNKRTKAYRQWKNSKRVHLVVKTLEAHIEAMTVAQGL